MCIDEYFINSGTAILIPINGNTTKVIEVDNEIIVNTNCFNIIKKTCMYYGSTYEGRFNGSKYLLKINYKLPIIIEECSELIFFPTCSPRSEDCHWINVNEVLEYINFERKTLITFKNRTKFLLNISFTSFEYQMYRSSMLALIMRKNRK